MRALFAGIGIALAATVAQAQWDVSIMPMSSKAVIDLRDQFNNSVSKGCVGVAVNVAVNPRATDVMRFGVPQGRGVGMPVRLRYSYTPQTGGETTILSPRRLVVNGVDFSKEVDSQTTSAQRKEDESVVIEWSVKPAHSFEVEVGRLGILRPMIAMEAIRGSVSATGKPKDRSETITATEDFNSTFIAFGCSARAYASQDLWTDARLAFGSGYEHAEVSANMLVANNIFVAGGYRHRVLRFGNGITVRRGDVFGEVGVRF